MSGVNFPDRPVMGVNLTTGEVMLFSSLTKAEKYIKQTWPKRTYLNTFKKTSQTVLVDI